MPQGSDAPSAHRRPGYSLSGCTPAEPDSASPGAGESSRALGLLQGQRKATRFDSARYLSRVEPRKLPAGHAGALGKDALKKSKKIPGVPVENVLTSFFL